MPDRPEFSVEGQILRRLHDCRQACRFDGQRPEQLWRWQVEQRQQFRRAMRLSLPTVYTPPHAERIETAERDGIRIDLLAVEIESDFWLPVHLLRAPDGHDGKTLVVLHGQGRGANDATGTADPTQEGPPAYAATWARDGFVVAVPELRGFGRLRLADDRTTCDAGAAQDSADRLMAIYLWLGQSYAGCCVGDLVRLLDYLESLPEVDPDRIGVAGVGAGAHAFSWLAAIEDRIAAGSLASTSCRGAESLLEPGLGPPPVIESFGIVDPIAILACHAPRPLYLQARAAGCAAATGTEESPIDRLAALYLLCGAPDRLVLNQSPDDTHLDDAAVLRFFDQWL
jgi:dienelactone hydrolase